jgi:hypothetical protein
MQLRLALYSPSSCLHLPLQSAGSTDAQHHTSRLKSSDAGIDIYMSQASLLQVFLEALDL